ncbi:MAG TPA: EAL domain-containing protein [Xanthobacteraceae bacterium]|nr:EAL domain-containing protein [Xanthobacteraceae bacterium]
MHRFRSVFVVICMVLIAVSAGVALHFAAGLPRAEAAIVTVALMFALVLCEVLAVRAREYNAMLDRYENLARASAEIAREVGKLGHRVAALEIVPSGGAKASTETLGRDVRELNTLMHELAESVAMHEAMITTPRPGEILAAPAPAPSATNGRARPAPAAATQAAPGEFSQGELPALVRAALSEGRIELYLQPVVALPSRKVRFYEALSRLRLADGATIEASRFLNAARAAGVMPRIDLRQTLQCIHIARRLTAKSRDVGFFVNLAPETLSDRRVLHELLAQLDANRALASSIVFEFAQGSFRVLGSPEREGLDALAERGFHFSIDQVENLRLDPREVAARGVRFLKVPCDLMLRRTIDAAGVRPADLADLLGRYGIDLVVDKIEKESAVVQLLDCDVRYGQGLLFAPPRAVRAEVLRADSAAAAAAPAEPPPAAAEAEEALEAKRA